jgi:hypothetical protein
MTLSDLFPGQLQGDPDQPAGTLTFEVAWHTAQGREEVAHPEALH